MKHRRKPVPAAHYEPLGWLYRVEDEWADHEEGSHARVVLEAYPITRITPGGCWIDISRRPRAGAKWERFVPDNASRPFAYSTKMAALNSFGARKVRQVRFIEMSLQRAQEARDIAARLRAAGIEPRGLHTEGKWWEGRLGHTMANLDWIEAPPSHRPGGGEP